MTSFWSLTVKLITQRCCSKLKRSLMGPVATSTRYVPQISTLTFRCIRTKSPSIGPCPRPSNSLRMTGPSSPSLKSASWPRAPRYGSKCKKMTRRYRQTMIRQTATKQSRVIDFDRKPRNQKWNTHCLPYGGNRLGAGPLSVLWSLLSYLSYHLARFYHSIS